MNITLPLQIRRHLGNEPSSYCDSCLALRFKESLEDARAAALIVAREDGFNRKVSTCTGCSRAIEMTVLTK